MRPRTISADEQISFIRKAVEEGWAVVCVTTHYLSPPPSVNGYAEVVLYRDGEEQKFEVCIKASLVAEEFMK